MLLPLAEKPRRKSVPLGPGAVKHLEEELQGHQATIAMEGSHSVGQLFLLEVMKRGHDVREVHPFVSKRFREALTEDHTDQKDADGLALLVRWKPDLPSVQFSAVQAAYKRLSRLRQQLVRERTRYQNRLHACLSEAYGATYKSLFRKLGRKPALRFFQDYPTINDALAADSDVPLRIGPKVWERLQEAGSWSEGPYLVALRAEVRSLTRHVQDLHENVAGVEREMTLLPRNSELALLLRERGIGISTALTIVGNTGDVRRFDGDADRFVAYAGLAPAMHQSGAGRPSGRVRLRFNRYLKNALMFWAFNLIRVQERAREFYRRKRDEGKRHWAALRALARHLCRLVFRILNWPDPSLRIAGTLLHEPNLQVGQPPAVVSGPHTAG